ncbi:MAG: hypothetical protein RMJ88_16880, partial [Thermogemmata sp.]|nr:hypothetical protein [Thermogemmata sp.]
MSGTPPAAAATAPETATAMHQPPRQQSLTAAAEVHAAAAWPARSDGAGRSQIRHTRSGCPVAMWDAKDTSQWSD